MPVTSGKTTTQSNSSSRTTSGSRETGNYNRLAASLNGTPPNATRGQSSSNSGSGLGLTVSKTMPGNTAYGPAGGMATSYGTRTSSSGNSRAAGQNVGPASSMAQSAQKSAKQYISPNAATVMVAPPSGPNYKKVPLADVAKQIATASKQFGKQFGKPVPLADVANKLANSSKKFGKAVAGKPGLSYKYNYEYPKGFNYANYFSNPTDAPMRRVQGADPTTARQTSSTGSTMDKNRSGTEKDQSRVPRRVPGRVPDRLPPPTGESYIKTK